MIAFLCMILVTTHYVIVQATTQHMVCKTVDNVFSEESNTRSSIRHQGIPGKRGVKGDIGPPGVEGQQGLPGVVDYEKVNATIEEFVKSVEKSTKDKIEKMEERIFAKLNETIEQLTAIACEGVIFELKCYWAEITTDRIIYNDAFKVCNSKAGKPADILNQFHYNLIEEYIRSRIPPSKVYVQLWLAMTLDIPSLVVRLSDGSRAAYVKFYPQHPKSIPDYTQMLIHVNKNPNEKKYGRGMFGTLWSNARNGVLCQK